RVPAAFAYPGTVKPLGPPLWHRHGVWDVTFGPDGRTLMTKAHDEVRLWTPNAGSGAGSVLPFPGEVRQAAFGADGTTIVAAGEGFDPAARTKGFQGAHYHEVRCWDAKSGQPLGVPVRCHQFAVVAFSPDGRT